MTEKSDFIYRLCAGIMSDRTIRRRFWNFSGYWETTEILAQSKDLYTIANRAWNREEAENSQYTDVRFLKPIETK